MPTYVQRRRQLVVKFLTDKRVRVSGDALEAPPRMLTVGDELTINYEVLAEASEGVEAAIQGALALEGKHVSRTK